MRYIKSSVLVVVSQLYYLFRSVLSIGPHAFNSDPILTVMIPT